MTPVHAFGLNRNRLKLPFSPLESRGNENGGPTVILCSEESRFLSHDHSGG